MAPRSRETTPIPLRHQVAEIPPVRPDVDEYRLHRLTCSCCGTATRAELPAGVPTGPFGPRLRAILAMFAGSYRLAKRPIQQLASDLFGLDISLGMISKLERRAAEVLEPVVAEVAAAIVAAPSAHIDETSWSEANEKAWLWVGQTDDLTAFTIADNRGADVARSILGTDREKVVISDRFPSYDWIEQHQYCWSHLRRDFQAMIDRQDEGSAVGSELLGSSDRLFHWWHKYRDGEMAWSTFLGYARPIRWGVRQALGRGAVVRQREDGGDVPDVAGGRGAPVDLPPGAGDRADEQRGGAGAAARRAVAEVERRDGERVGQPVRRAGPERGGDLPPAGPERAGVPDRVLPGPAVRSAAAFTPAATRIIDQSSPDAGMNAHFSCNSRYLNGTGLLA